MCNSDNVFLQTHLFFCPYSTLLCCIFVLNMNMDEALQSGRVGSEAAVGAPRRPFEVVCSPVFFQDELIEKEKASYTISGGCCAIAAMDLMGKLYVANAGDSR